jgi:hypothetical protein
MEQPDRSCPSTSSCANGYCQPPNNAQSCANPTDCGGGTVCSPFVRNQNQLEGDCAPRFGTATTCSAAGFDSTCAAGYCIATNNKFACLLFCDKTNECPNGQTCASRSITVEGFTAPMMVCGF